jgi:signal peptidase I
VQEEPYVVHDGSHNPYRDDFPNAPAAGDPNINVEWQLRIRNFIDGGDIVVPPEHYFGMGDNRDVSLDSRYWGFIPKENVIGRPMFVYWSFITPGNEHLKTDLRDRIAFTAHVVLHFIDETRWRRMLRPVR